MNHCREVVIKMEFKVNKIAYEKEDIIVTGKTEIGELKGIWRYKEAPVKNQNYHVRLSYNRLEKKISKYSGKKLSVLVHGKINTFYGEIDGMDEEIFCVRFTKDWIDMVRIDDASAGLVMGDYISYSVKYNDIEIFPFDLI